MRQQDIEQEKLARDSAEKEQAYEKNPTRRTLQHER
jgi:hypothetical protein